MNSYNNLDLNKLKKIIKSEISENKKKFNCVNLIDLPDVILNSSDIYEFEKKIVHLTILQKICHS